MLYKLVKTGKSSGSFDSLEPCPFNALPLEKDLENLMAQNLLEVLFEGYKLMPILQERARQPEADIYAVNEQGDLVIFELKRAQAGAGAIHQALRYCEAAGQWGYEKLQSQLRKYRGEDSLDLQKEHQVAFDLEHPLDRSAFNRRQRLIVVGSAGDSELIRNVDYWKGKGLWIDFIPYRIYEIAGEHYFEFFSHPYDQHSNPAHVKGVIFDTNRTYDEDGIWYMCEGRRVAAFGDIMGIVHSFKKGDIVFLYHKGLGIVAAGEVVGEVKEDPGAEAMYRDLKWLTPVPQRGEWPNAMSASRIKEVMGFNFWWASTMKAPYLNKDESSLLLEALKECLGTNSRIAEVVNTSPQL